MRGDRDLRDLEIERLEAEVERLREREWAARAETEDACRYFSELSAVSKRFAASVRGGVAERRQYRRRLGAQLAVSHVLAGAHDLGEAAPKVFEILGERLGWEVGALWTVEEAEAGEVLRLSCIWRYAGRPAGALEEASRALTFRRGVGLPGRVWERGEPVWVEDVMEDDELVRKAAAADGLRGALAFPIRDGGLVGVFELFSGEGLSPDEGLMRTAALIGEQTGQFVQRRHAEEQRDDSLARERAARLEAEAERTRLAAVLQQMPGGVFIADDSGRVILANEGAKRIYGKDLGSIEECGRLSRSYPDGAEVPPEDNPLNRALGGESLSGVEHYVLRADGTRGVVRTNAAPVRDAEGRVVAAVKAFEDITEYKEASRALRESEERLRTVVEGTPVILVSLDREGVYTLAEGQGLRGLGLEPGEPVGRSVFELFGDEPEVVATVRRALAGEVVVENVSARGRVFEAWYTPLRDEEGEVCGVIGVATDVTGRKLAEEERDRSRVAELAARAEVEEAQRRLAFYAGAREERKMISRELHDRVAHSMAVVRQCLELYGAFKDRAPEAAAAKLEQAKEEAKSALSATRDLSMMLRRSEIGGGLGKALSDLLETTVPPDVRYEVGVEGDEAAVPPHVGNQLFLILREAVRNAVTHSGCKRVTVGLVVSPEEVTGAVEDDGLGVGNAEVGGVGMRAMKERAALLGGALRVSSRPDAGTRVEVSVPLAQEDVR